MSAAMSPTYHQRPMPGTQEPGNHSFTSKDSGTGDSVPTEHNQFLSKFKQKLNFEKSERVKSIWQGADFIIDREKYLRHETL